MTENFPKLLKSIEIILIHIKVTTNLRAMYTPGIMKPLSSHRSGNRHMNYLITRCKRAWLDCICVTYLLHFHSTLDRAVVLLMEYVRFWCDSAHNISPSSSLLVDFLVHSSKELPTAYLFWSVHRMEYIPRGLVPSHSLAPQDAIYIQSLSCLETWPKSSRIPSVELK